MFMSAVLKVSLLYNPLLHYIKINITSHVHLKNNILIVFLIMITSCLDDEENWNNSKKLVSSWYLMLQLFYYFSSCIKMITQERFVHIIYFMTPLLSSRIIFHYMRIHYQWNYKMLEFPTSCICVSVFRQFSIKYKQDIHAYSFVQSITY